MNLYSLLGPCKRGGGDILKVWTAKLHKMQRGCIYQSNTGCKLPMQNLTMKHFTLSGRITGMLDMDRSGSLGGNQSDSLA